MIFKIFSNHSVHFKIDLWLKGGSGSLAYDTYLEVGHIAWTLVPEVLFPEPTFLDSHALVSKAQQLTASLDRQRAHRTISQQAYKKMLHFKDFRY